MLTQKLMKDYGCTDITQYFEEMLAQLMNGHPTTVRRQFRGLGREQRKKFLAYLVDGIREPDIIPHSPEFIGYALKLCIEEIY